MAQSSCVRDLTFKSAGYYFNVGPFRLKLPSFLTPGNLTVTHDDCGNAQFDFGLRLEHPIFGCLLKQVGHYREESH